jgi:hypothetical protein
LLSVFIIPDLAVEEILTKGHRKHMRKKSQKVEEGAERRDKLRIDVWNHGVGEQK